MADDGIELFIGLIESIDMPGVACVVSKHEPDVADGSRAAGGLRISRNAWPLQEAAE